MAEIKIAAVLRSGAYSPNHIGTDAAILNLVCDQLRKRGCEVRTCSEEQLIAAGGVDEPIVIHMCRDKRSFPLLQAMEDGGKLVVNSGYGVENCTRERLTRIFVGQGIPSPDSITVNTNERVTAQMERASMTRAWIKRGDSYAQHKEDVTYVHSPQEAQEVLQEYFMRGINRAVIHRHLEGEEVKFYGVRGTQWFHCFMPFGQEPSPAPGTPSKGKGGKMGESLPFDREELHRVCTRAAEELDVTVYGGKAVIDAKGRFSIIDFNDWPSFRPCRAEAAPVIARAILAMVKKHNSR